MSLSISSERLVLYVHALFGQDFNLSGSRIVSCGMDHSLKMWNLDTSEIEDVIAESKKFNPAKGNR